MAAADRDLADARKDVSEGWRFATAYTAALRLCSVVLFATGCRAVREQRHFRTIAALPLIIDPELLELSTYLNRCRSKRHAITYEAAAVVSHEEADELIAAVGELRDRVQDWLACVHPDVVP